MLVRPFEERDRECLTEIRSAAGYETDKIQGLENYLVVEMDGEIFMAGGYRLIPEVGLICPRGGPIHPLVKLEGIKLLHEELRATLVSKGFTEAIATIPPEIERSYGRHLRRLGWSEAWKAFKIKDWKGGR
jgi:hypothetical protein